MENPRILLRSLRAGVLFCAVALLLLSGAPPAEASEGCCCGTGASTCRATMDASCQCSMESPPATLGTLASWGEWLAPAPAISLATPSAHRSTVTAAGRCERRSDRPRVRPPRVG